jgi:Sensors of blue-light using FAD
MHRTTPTRMNLTRLIYASVARTGMDYAELTNILRTAGEHNGANSVTGLLCFSNGAFLQALEGDRDVVNRLYNRIVPDPRHSQCTILRYGRVVSRSFNDWSMKLVGLDDQPTAKRRALIMRHSGRAVFDPLDMTGAQATAFLEELAHLERRAA